MPEKPEVVTVSKMLNKELVGKEITGCNIYHDGIIVYPKVSLFKNEIIGQKVEEVTTRGKWIVIKLTTKVLLVHLRMEGKFFFREIGEEKLSHEHVEFILDDLVSFRYHDVRKFGKMHLLDKSNYLDVAPLNKLGVEYNDKILTGRYLRDIIIDIHKPIKNILLDQSIITGIGNIYVNEILYLSKISPRRCCIDVKRDDCEEIVKNTKLVLDKAIKAGGTTIKSFTSSEGVHGLFQQQLKVHGKEGKACPVCGKTIVKIKLFGRGTYMCPLCQKW